jgi:putative colanic acid biosynthesis acetyltransferase WcaF
MSSTLPINEAEAEQKRLHEVRAHSQLPRVILAKRLTWVFVQWTLYKWSFHTSNNWRAFLLRSFGADIGARCTIRRTSRVYYPWKLKMGSLSCLGDDVTVYNLGHVTLGDRATISQEAYICAGTHDYTKLTMPLLTPPVVLGADSWVCARAFIGPGVTVGEGAIVGAAAVAMKNVTPWTIVAGNPARYCKDRPKPT